MISDKAGAREQQWKRGVGSRPVISGDKWVTLKRLSKRMASSACAGTASISSMKTGSKEMARRDKMAIGSRDIFTTQRKQPVVGPCAIDFQNTTGVRPLRGLIFQ